MWTLADLLTIYGPFEPSGEGNMVFSEVTIDSRQSIPGGLFAALRGEHHDGHDFISEALERGCRGALGCRDRLPAERRAGLPARIYEWDGKKWLRSGPKAADAVLVLVPDVLEALQRLAARWRKRFSPTVIGVTGSVGKSTTKEVIAAVLRRGWPTLKSEKSYNNEIGLPLALLGLRPEHRAVVLEMGTYGPGEIAHLAEISLPHIGVVTNVSHSHLERMKTLETIARAKSELPAALPPDGLAVLNGDEALIRGMAKVTRARILFYGLGRDCHYRAEALESLGLKGISFTLQAGEERRRLRCALPGRHSVYTALAAAAVGRHLGLPWDEIEAGLLDTSAQIRLLPVPAVNGATLLDDTYNASPTSCQAALDLLAELPGRKVAVLGDMLELGSYEEEGHRQVGRRAAEVVEELFLLGKRARWIGEAALERGMPAGRVHRAQEREEVIRLLRKHLQPGDIVLIKGSRAMEMEHIVAALRQEEG